MISPSILATGTPGAAASATGPVLEWRDSLLDDPTPLANAVVYDRGPTPLFRAAFIAEHGAAALLMAEGGKNYHPLILAAEAGLPSIAGIGSHHEWAGRVVTVEAGRGTVREGVAAVAPSAGISQVTVPADAPEVYVNVGYPSGLRAAAESGAAGLGLMRTEFAAVRTLALNLNAPLEDGRSWRALLEQVGNEADALYAIAGDRRSSGLLRQGLRAVVGETVERFGTREVIIRTLDIARRLDEPMGNRGIRRCVGSGGATIRLLCAAIRDVLDERGGRIGLILPLVSHYGQIKSTVDALLAGGLTLRRPGSDAPRQIAFGWEIEQPAASQNNRLWLAAFTAEFGQPPHLIGIGTNDLTQFTIALGRDVYTEETDAAMADYLRALYDEHEFSVVRQIVEAAAECRRVGTRVFLLGQAGADPLLAPLLFACGITPSVSAAKVGAVQTLAAGMRASGAGERALRAYRDRVLGTYPESARVAVESELDEFFAALRA
jgi:phosphoenolpyruvate-protein kinase (PTS system EI component)